MKVCQLSASYLIYKCVGLKNEKEESNSHIRSLGQSFLGFQFLPLVFVFALQVCQVSAFNVI
jgi:hypothetical protein